MSLCNCVTVVVHAIVTKHTKYYIIKAIKTALTSILYYYNNYLSHCLFSLLANLIVLSSVHGLRQLFYCRRHCYPCFACVDYSHRGELVILLITDSHYCLDDSFVFLGVACCLLSRLIVSVVIVVIAIIVAVTVLPMLISSIHFYHSL